MNMIDYQHATRQTAIYPKEDALNYLLFGLCSEVGELAGKWKKKIRDGKFDEQAFVCEAGDCLWYLARITDELGYDLGLVAENNMSKLMDRKERGVIGGNGDGR